MTDLLRAGALYGFDDLARRLGVNPLKLLKAAGLPASQLRNPDNLIPYRKVGKVLELAALESGTPTFGLQLAESNGLHVLGLFGAYMSRQGTIAEALNIGSRYAHLHAQGVVLAIEPAENGNLELRLNITFIHGGEFPQLVDLSIGMVIQILRDMAGDHWHARRIKFRHPAHQKTRDNYKDFFACAVEFNSDRDAITIDQATLAQKPMTPEGLVNQVIFSQFEQLKIDEDLTPLVKHAIHGLLPTGDCNKTNVALALDIHPKKLQRALDASHTSFRALLEETRREIAENAVFNSNMPLTNIALNLGYADLAVFSRSFKRWFGFPPSAAESRRGK
ncbi:AraC family transcriptional regulator [Microbulbifer sp. CAU 1566]|uniref:AraC family transcriptional regulator n=1 Tax=Microbulbifer sp. CAU 1566 TaxID=2933269 RepID=UPI00200394E4|nr:AraC family transcriptional regulator [Microbulbifer sp. CAU 1566]MCK7597657.1 AraC family transcriptional regulator [Microbulbifer sp. CAU 1566]